MTNMCFLDRYQVMFIFYLLLLQQLQPLLAFPHHQRKLKVSKDAMKEGNFSYIKKQLYFVKPTRSVNSEIFSHYEAQG